MGQPPGLDAFALGSTLWMLLERPRTSFCVPKPPCFCPLPTWELGSPHWRWQRELPG